MNVENAPFLWDHAVNDIPTMPAAFLTSLVAKSVQKMRPELKISAFERTDYRRFVRVFPNRGVLLRVHCTILSEDAGNASVQVKIQSDFVHESGRILGKDILHSQTVVRLVRDLPASPPVQFEAERIDGWSLPDPYVLSNVVVQLKGQFASMDRVHVGSDRRIAKYQLKAHQYPESLYGHLLPNMIMVNAFWRFGTVQLVRDRTLAVYVPEHCGIMYSYFDYTDFASPGLLEKMTFRGTNPRPDGDLLHVGPIEVSDSKGKVILVVEGGVCRKLGEIEHAF